MLEGFVAALFSVSVLGVAISAALLAFTLGMWHGWCARGEEPCAECGAARQR